MPAQPIDTETSLEATAEALRQRFAQDQEQEADQ